MYLLNFDAAAFNGGNSHFIVGICCVFMFEMSLQVMNQDWCNW